MPALYPKLHAYAVAVAAVLAMIAVRSVLDPVLREVAPVILFMIPVAFSAWYGGLGPGLLATVLGGAAGIAMFSSPARTVALAEHGRAFFWTARGVPFFLVGLSISLLADLAERSRLRAMAMGRTLSSQQERYRTLFDSVDDGFCIIEMLYDAAGKPVDYRYLEVNGAFTAQTGLPDMVGRTIREIYPDHDAYWYDIYGRIVATGEPQRFTNEAKAMGRWYDVYACRVGDAGSRQVAVLFNDITAKRLAEIERERLLASETQARQAAEQASRMKDEFLATVSHELRTPLTAITGWAGLLQQVKGEPKMLDEGLDVIGRNAAIQAQLIEDILDVSRITSGKLRLNVRTIDLRGPIHAAIDTVANAAAAKNVAIDTVGFEHAVDTAGDPERLQQVFWNLLANAIKFTDGGGRIAVTLRPTNGLRTVEVADTGRGIEADFLPYVFDRFRQADMTSTRRQGGLGLGLSIVRHLVEMHGGTVGVDSDGPARGSVFSVRLPYTPAAFDASTSNGVRPARRVVDAGPKPALAGARVLVLDDEPDARRVIEVTLGRCGVAVTPVGTVAAAVAALENDATIDCVISDIGLPEEDGYAFARRLTDLESRGVLRRVPRAALTAYTRDSDRRAVLAAGFDFFLTKPVNAEDLMQTVSAMLRARMTSKGATRAEAV